MKKNTKNAFITGLMMSALTSTVRPIIQSGSKLIYDRLTHSISITDWVYSLAKGLDKFFPNAEDVFFINNKNEVSFEKNISAYAMNAKSSGDIIFYNGYPIKLAIVPFKNEDNNSRTGFYLVTINTHNAVENMKDFIRECARINHEYLKRNCSENMIVFSTTDGCGMKVTHIDNFSKRTFHNVFIPDAQETLIKNTLTEFIHNREWYKENNIPYHLGFLLYGGGGHGKSCIAQAIADYIGAEMYVFPGDAVSQLPRNIGSRITRETVDPSVYRVICIEDIDCGFAESKMETVWNGDEEKSVKRKVGLAEILNCIDGIQAPVNTIYVFTTNHIENLDPALIRPGRCDVRLEVTGPTIETFRKFVVYHYGEDGGKYIDRYFSNDIDVNPSITFAELQTDVMKGALVSDLCEKVKISKGVEKE